MAEELKPCASCGGESQMAEGFAVLEVWPHGTFYRAYCTVCQLRQLFYRTEAEAIAAWNRRAAPEPAAPTVVEPDWDYVRECAEEATGLTVERHTYSIVIREVRKWLAATPPRAPQDDKYNELLFAVGNKYPGETRHETALRYIRQAEQSRPETDSTGRAAQ